ncbi:hypothetical protein CDL12_12533 [Handroanthus impetiginosus]|uniref:Uncharacterized protein n=1 Tax=Handroanthus impetiginosus TaxID=429701 RepID=A0A2G9HBD1_9LAMI|nr:hypothetical protein CDL12_12533 [Handroanthus impetiginosus]
MDPVKLFEEKFSPIKPISCVMLKGISPPKLLLERSMRLTRPKWFAYLTSFPFHMK